MSGILGVVRKHLLLRKPCDWFISFRTPLMLAVEQGHLDTVIYLMSNSAIVNARDIHGRTALHRGVSDE